MIGLCLPIGRRDFSRPRSAEQQRPAISPQKVCLPSGNTLLANLGKRMQMSRSRTEWPCSHIAVIQLACTADLRTNTPAGKVPAIAADWTGFYVSESFGGRWTDSPWTTSAIGDPPGQVEATDDAGILPQFNIKGGWLHRGALEPLAPCAMPVMEIPAISCRCSRRLGCHL